MAKKRIKRPYNPIERAKLIGDFATGQAKDSDPVAAFIEKYIGADDVVLDIGANQGSYTKLFCKNAREVHAFEPNSEAFTTLQRNIVASNATLVPMAVSDHPGTMDFYLDKRPGLGGMASSVYALDDLVKNNLVEKIEVEATTIDNYCTLNRIHPGFIKIDVEGHEPAVFEGGAETIEQNRPIIIFEFWETWWGGGYSDLFSRLSKCYDLIRVQDGADALVAYQSQDGQGTVDIGCLPCLLRPGID